MRILLHELKKIFTWKILLILLIVNSVLYFLLIEFEITHFPNGRPALDSYRISIEMIEKYGPTMEEEEFIDFVHVYEEKVEEANKWIQARQDFAAANIDSYEKYRNIQHDDEVGNALHSKVMFEEEVDLFWELQERERLIQFHEMKELGLEAMMNDANESQKARLQELEENKQYQVYSEVVFKNYKRFIQNVAITILFSVVFVISPIFIKDRTRQLLELQYSMKIGRNIFKTKVIAGLISTFLVVTTLLIVYFGFYSLNNTSMFFNVPIHTFIGDYYWYDPTFFQYILLTIVAIYVISFSFALLAMSFSSIMPNYISLIGVQIPFVVFMIGYGIPNVLSRIISILHPKWFVPTFYSCMMIICIAFLLFLWKREKKRDIVL